MEHPSAVVLHLSGNKIKVPGLVVSNPNIKLVILASLRGFSCGPENLNVKSRLRPQQQQLDVVVE